MDKKERIRAAISGDFCDTVPMAFWLPSRFSEGTPEEAASKAWTFAADFDADLIVTVNGSAYSAEDYTAPDFIKNGGVSYSRDPSDWERLGAASVNGGALARELAGLKRLLEKAEGTPVLFRVMSPLATAAMLAPHIWEDLRRGNGRLVKEALASITETACALVQRAIEMGADGIFFEAPLADHEKLSENFYREYGAPYDHAALSASQGWCNVLRCGETNAMFSLLRKYPAEIFSWDASQSLPALDEAQALTGKCVMAGLSRRHLEFGMKNHVRHDLCRALKMTRGRGIILSAGAAVQPHRSAAAFLLKEKKEIEARLGIGK